MRVTHEKDCAGWRHGRRDEYDPCESWCYGCMRCEPMRPDDYRVCGECFHVYRTAEQWCESVWDDGLSPVDWDHQQFMRDCLDGLDAGFTREMTRGIYEDIQAGEG